MGCISVVVAIVEMTLLLARSPAAVRARSPRWGTQTRESGENRAYMVTCCCFTFHGVEYSNIDNPFLLSRSSFSHSRHSKGHFSINNILSNNVTTPPSRRAHSQLIQDSLRPWCVTQCHDTLGHP